MRVEGLSGAVALAAGQHVNCALLMDDPVKCWGSGAGNGADDPFTATTVSGLSDVTAIDTGSSHSCALLDNGAVKVRGTMANWATAIRRTN